MNNFYNLSLKKRYSLFFLISFSLISFSILLLILFLFINSQDTLTIRWPVILLLLPIYLIIRLLFIKIEKNKNIEINKTEEIIKLLLLFYFLIFISIKFFPLNKKFFENSLTITFLSFNIQETLFTAKLIIQRYFIENLILFMPLGFLLPIVITKFKNVSNCIIFSLILSIIVALIDILLNFFGLDFVNVTSLDLIFINIFGTLIGYRLYYFLIQHNSNISKSLSSFK